MSRAFDEQVDAVRIGTIIAFDKKAGDRWRRMRQRAQGTAGQALTGADLERTILGLAVSHPDLVLVKTAA
jgi:hypothetical protein